MQGPQVVFELPNQISAWGANQIMADKHCMTLSSITKTVRDISVLILLYSVHCLSSVHYN